MSLLDVGKIAIIAATPTLVGAAVIYGPKWCLDLFRRLPERTPRHEEPAGLPIQQLAADLRRLLRLHDELSSSAHIAMTAHRLWAVEAAIEVRAIEAARALGIDHPEPAVPGQLNCAELQDLLQSLAVAGLVLPAVVGPFTRGGRL